MNSKTCFFIGNRHAPSSIEQQLAKVVEQHITEYNVTIFTVGYYGSFDSLVTGVLKEAKKRKIKTIYLKTELINYYEKFGAVFIKELSNGENLYKIDIN